MPLPKPLSDIRKEVEGFVKNSNTIGAFDYLQALLPEGVAKRTQTTLVQSKWSNANQKYNTGQIAFGDHQIELAQVNAAILEIANGLSESDFSSADAPKPVVGVPKYVVVYNNQDKPHFDLLKKQLAVLKRFGKIDFYDVYQPASGDLVQQANEQIATADYLLVLITPDLFNMEPIDWFDVVSKAIGAGSKMIPLRIKTLGFDLPELEKLKSLPPMNQWVSDLGNQDNAYAEIARLLPK